MIGWQLFMFWSSVENYNISQKRIHISLHWTEFQFNLTNDKKTIYNKRLDWFTEYIDNNFIWFQVADAGFKENGCKTPFVFNGNTIDQQGTIRVYIILPRFVPMATFLPLLDIQEWLLGNIQRIIPVKTIIFFWKWAVENTTFSKFKGLLRTTELLSVVSCACYVKTW